MVTIEQVSAALPANLKRNASQSLVDKINNIVTDSEHAETLRNNFLSYTRVLQEGKFKIDDYLNAIMYVSYKLMGYSNQDSYIKTFPNRYQELAQRGADAKEISAYVSMYNKGKLVNLILEQALVPTWILNQDLYQKALNTQADLMVNARSEMVQMSAANSILLALAKPKEAGPLVNLSINGETSGLNELKESLNRLAKQQLDLIASGVTTKTIAAQAIIETKIE
jgi:hypothetical protein